MNYPIATIKSKSLEIHDHKRQDDYFWMNDRENPEVIQYLREENEYLDQSLKETESFKESLFEEMKSRIKEDDESVPYFKDGYFHYHRFQKGDEYPLFCRKKNSLTETEEIILNVNELAEGYQYFQVGQISLSTDQKILAYAEDHVGRRIYTLKFKDLKTGLLLEDKIEGASGNMVWANDNKTVFYTRQDAQTLRSFQIYRHELGENPENDLLVYEEKDDTFNCHVSKSKSKKFLFIQSHSTISSEFRFLSADEPNGTFEMLQERVPDLEYQVEHFGEDFYILTNAKKATNFKLVKVSIENPGLENWIEVIPHREAVLLESFEIFRNFLVLEERFEGLTRIRIKPWEKKDSFDLDFEEPTYTAWIGHNPEFETDVLRFGFNSLITPASVFDYNMITGEKKLLKQQEVVGGYDAIKFQSEKIWAIAEDGVKIPISLVYKKDLFQKNGNNPLLQYAYGSYGYSTDPTFSPSRLSLLERGFVFAIAHIRGGQEMGRQWYDTGKMLKKKNTFTDFIACSEYLIKEKYTSPEHLYAMGGSAGGLLMGVVINLKPELYKGVIAAVPFVDVVTTMLDETIPLTTGEFHEWGNPKEKEFYDYILSYSPYDNIERKAYPNLLVISGLHDSQVQYWEPTKWVAKLRQLKTDRNLLLLSTNMEAGHGGASGRFKALKELALEYVFLCHLEGLKK
ncbi:S9 family peptidase [Rhodonellum sp.]|uniref:S9 family peptidase n=1 Tax=Rhodonellum sp. TaxID=2231180 RepID=UPI00271DBFD9|nr:S9 family peptidase [Rhodonellum sp.]MDO9554866.1 S9 family peptidase [Rhodonellum sp.]